MPRLAVRRADRRLALYQGRIDQAGTEKSLANALAGFVLGEIFAATPEQRPALMKRLEDLAREMNKEARR